MRFRLILLLILHLAVMFRAQMSFALPEQAHRDAFNYYSNPSSDHEAALAATLDQLRAIVQPSHDGATLPPYQEIGDFLISVFNRARINPNEISALTPATYGALEIYGSLIREASQHSPDERSTLVRNLARFIRSNQELVEQPLTQQLVKLLIHEVTVVDRQALRLIRDLLNSSQDSPTWRAAATATAEAMFMGRYKNDAYGWVTFSPVLIEWLARNPIDAAITARDREELNESVKMLTQIRTPGLQLRALSLIRDVMLAHVNPSLAHRYFITVDSIQGIHAMRVLRSRDPQAELHREILRLHPSPVQIQNNENQTEAVGVDADAVFLSFNRALQSSSELEALGSQTQQAIELLNETLAESARLDPVLRTALIARLSRMIRDNRARLNHPLVVRLARVLLENINAFDLSAQNLLVEIINRADPSLTAEALTPLVADMDLPIRLHARTRSDPRFARNGSTSPDFNADWKATLTGANHLSLAMANLARWANGNTAAPGGQVRPLGGALRSMFESAIIKLTEITAPGLQLRALMVIRMHMALHYDPNLRMRRFFTPKVILAIRQMVVHPENPETSLVRRDILNMLNNTESPFPVYHEVTDAFAEVTPYLEQRVANGLAEIAPGIDAMYAARLLAVVSRLTREADQVRALQALLGFYEFVEQHEPQRLLDDGDLHAGFKLFSLKIQRFRQGSDFYLGMAHRLALLMARTDQMFCELSMLPEA